MQMVWYAVSKLTWLEVKEIAGVSFMTTMWGTMYF